MTVNLVNLSGPGANGSPVSGRNDPFAANYSTKWSLRQGKMIRPRTGPENGSRNTVLRVRKTLKYHPKEVLGPLQSLSFLYENSALQRGLRKIIPSTSRGWDFDSSRTLRMVSAARSPDSGLNVHCVLCLMFLRITGFCRRCYSVGGLYFFVFLRCFFRFSTAANHLHDAVDDEEEDCEDEEYREA